MSSSELDYSPKEIDQFLHSMNIIFYLAVCVPLLFFVLIFLDLQKKGGVNPSFETGESILHLLLAVAFCLLALPGYVVYKKILTQHSVEDKLQQKLKVFKEAAIKKYLFIFMASCGANLLLFFYAEQLYLMAYAVLLILFSIDRPTIYRLKKDLLLTKEEKIALSEFRKYL